MHNITKIITWNVNGIRAALKKGFLDYLHKEDPDIICLQEIKAEKEQVDIEIPDYFEYWNSAKKKGYSGTAIFTKIKPLNVFFGININEHDQEGRVITLEMKNFYLVCVYTPNSKRKLLRLEYRQQWDQDFLSYLKDLEKNKPIIFCGDLNVAHQEIDLAHPKNNHHNAGFTDEERQGFNNIIQANFIDTFRIFNKEPHNYTWWSYFRNCRTRNIGWRIDYVCVSAILKDKILDSFIHPYVMGSDHCPVGIKIKTR